MEIIICKDYEEMSLEAFKRVKKLITEKPNAKLCLPSGSTPLGLYRHMIMDHMANGTSYKDVQTFNIDEFVPIAKNDPGSHYTYLKSNVFDFLDLQEKNIHYPYGIDYIECMKYEKLLEQNPIDLQILGIGSNGHIGFDEPGTPFDEPTHIVTLEESTRDAYKVFFNNDINNVPNFAITIGIGTIMEAQTIILMASGKNKAKAIQKALEEKPNGDCPASYLQLHPGTIVIIDEEAASLLKKK